MIPKWKISEILGGPVIVHTKCPAHKKQWDHMVTVRDYGGVKTLREKYKTCTIMWIRSDRCVYCNKRYPKSILMFSELVHSRL